MVSFDGNGNNIIDYNQLIKLTLIKGLSYNVQKLRIMDEVRNCIPPKMCENGYCIIKGLSLNILCDIIYVLIIGYITHFNPTNPNNDRKTIKSKCHQTILGCSSDSDCPHHKPNCGNDGVCYRCGKFIINILNL